jgi:ribosomal protein S18 acetylase RimI-like enzyme
MWFEEFPVNEEFIIQASLRPDFKLFVAESRGDVLGFAGVLFQEHVGRAEVGPISVSPGLRGRGIGSALLGKVVEFLREKKVHRVVVRVKSGNRRAYDFFASHGFSEEASLRNYTKKGEGVYQMVLFT